MGGIITVANTFSMVRTQAGNKNLQISNLFCAVMFNLWKEIQIPNKKQFAYRLLNSEILNHN